MINEKKKKPEMNEISICSVGYMTDHLNKPFTIRQFYNGD